MAKTFYDTDIAKDTKWMMNEIRQMQFKLDRIMDDEGSLGKPEAFKAHASLTEAHTALFNLRREYGFN
jgi:hypothetical protein